MMLECDQRGGDGRRLAAIMLGGHVRVGMEDNPFIEPGTYACTNAELFDKIVRISRDFGAGDRERGRGAG
jgi:uncharacterized protein (DUF849 family)